MCPILKALLKFCTTKSFSDDVKIKLASYLACFILRMLLHLSGSPNIRWQPDSMTVKGHFVNS